MVPAPLTLPRWYDLHAHLRQGALLRPMISAHLDMGCAGVLAMPNTRPPVGKVRESDPGACWSIEGYRRMLLEAGGDAFCELIVPLYLTKDTTPKMIEDGARTGLLRAAKYYPPHGTTGSEHASSFSLFMENGVFQAMADCGVIFCVHGEEHGLEGDRYLSRHTNAEEQFYRERMPPLIERHPHLKVVAEHLTTQVGVDFVLQAGSRVAATVTPQHLIYTLGDLLQGLRYHLFCMPVLKFDEDRQALRRAVTDPDNRQFFAGTDSAPHTQKATACGCAAGCFTGGVAPQLYAQAFDLAGADPLGAGREAFERFLCTNGPDFYGLPVSTETFTLTRAPQGVKALSTPEGDIIPLPLGAGPDCAQGETTVPWRIDQVSLDRRLSAQPGG